MPPIWIHLTVAVALLVAAVTPLGAHAGEEGSLNRARRLAASAERALQAGQLQRAHDDFQHAFQLSADATLLPRMAQALVGLGRPRDAAETLRAYLRARPDAPDRPTVEERIRALDASPEGAAAVPTSPTAPAMPPPPDRAPEPPSHVTTPAGAPAIPAPPAVATPPVAAPIATPAAPTAPDAPAVSPAMTGATSTAPPATAATAKVLSTDDSDEEPPRKRRWLPWVLAGGIVLVGGAVAVTVVAVQPPRNAVPATYAGDVRVTFP